jgi:predicted nucleic acid-binding protein
MQIVTEMPSTHQRWLDLVEKHQVQGVQVHDAHLIALMQSHGISNILTLNGTDFRRFAEITSLSPSEALASGV